MENFDSITRINSIVINMQYTQYVFYSLLSLQKHRVCVNGHQNNLNAVPGPRPRFLNFWIRPHISFKSTVLSSENSLNKYKHTSIFFMILSFLIIFIKQNVLYDLLSYLFHVIYTENISYAYCKRLYTWTWMTYEYNNK